MQRLINAFFWFLGLVSIANGLWMLAAGAAWFSGVPAAVPDTGPLNLHLVHDLGVVFCIVGLGAILCAINPQNSAAAQAGVTLFYVGHALVHVVEISTGHLPSQHWWIDAPLTFLPAIILLAIALPSLWCSVVARD